MARLILEKAGVAPVWYDSPPWTVRREEDAPPPPPPGTQPQMGALKDLGKVRSGYAGNIWHMLLHDSKIWLGGGNSADKDPERNAGSGDLKYIDTSTDKIVTSGYRAAAINEEQIDLFREIDGDLVFPGIDPRSGDTNIKFHRLKKGIWSNHVVGTNFKGTGTPYHHCFDIYKFDGQWFAAVGTHNAGNWEIFRRTAAPDGVGGWTNTQTAATIIGPRAVHFFEHAGVLYCTVYPFGGSPLAKWDGHKFIGSGLNRNVLFPNYTFTGGLTYINREVSIGNDLIYIGGYYHNDSHFRPFGLFKASANFASINRIAGVALQPDELPFDLKKRGGTAYVLTSRRVSQNVYQIRVRSSVSPFEAWPEIVPFEYPTFARSFEISEVWAYYFGMGTDWTTAQGAAQRQPSYTGVIKPEAGTVLKWS